MTRVLKKYQEQVVPKLKEEFKYSSPMQVPRLEKIVLNMGVGEAIANGKAIEQAQYILTQISGQKPVVTRARKSIANFKLREGMPIGCKVTIRQKRMYEFFDRLVSVALPRVRDFRGTPRKGFDGRGNYTLGVREAIVFPEVNIDKIDKVRGLDITFVTSAKSDEEGRALLEALGMPFRK
ncbi:MAG: 50S ribosomal protein L5 [Candidatus Dadabacteria bacterium]|nr:MAG: 50S ribosomal protein L5 [Candidatus Dadabacteria bacterium]